MSEDLTGQRVYQGPVGGGRFLGTVRSVHWDILNSNVHTGMTSLNVLFLVETESGEFVLAPAADVRSKP